MLSWQVFNLWHRITFIVYITLEKYSTENTKIVVPINVYLTTGSFQKGGLFLKKLSDIPNEWNWHVSMYNICLTPSFIHTVHCDCIQMVVESNPITSPCLSYLLHLYIYISLIFFFLKLTGY